MRCSEGRCSPLTTCDAQNPCANGFACVDSFCITQGACANDSDCGPNLSCDNQTTTCVKNGCANLQNLDLGVALAGSLVANGDNFYYPCEATCDDTGTCGNIGFDEVSDQAFKLTLDQPASITVNVTGIEAYVFIVTERDPNNLICSEEATVMACGPTVSNANIPAGDYYLIVEKVGGGTGNFSITVTAQ